MSIVTQETTALRLVETDSPPLLHGDIMTNPAMFDHVQRFARLLSASAFTPKHLKGSDEQRTVANCFRVAAQAMRWGYDPFAVADETYEVHGRLGYQGKLIIAVVNSRANMKGRLRFEYAGTDQNMTVTVVGQFTDEDSPRTVTLAVHQAKTSNEMWTKDPEQKLAYSGAIRWARRHCPEVVMGVQSVEDLERIADNEAANEKPKAKSLDALIAPTKQPKQEQAEPAYEPVAEGEYTEAYQGEPEPPQPQSDPMNSVFAWEMRVNEASGIAELDNLHAKLTAALGRNEVNAADAGKIAEMIADKKKAGVKRK